MELFAADGHDAGGCERVTGKSGMRPYATDVVGLSRDTAKALVADDIEKQLGVKERTVFDAVARAFTERLGEEFHIEKVGFAKGVVELVQASRVVPSEVVDCEELERRFKALLEHLAKLLRDARRREDERLSGNRLARAVAGFLADHPTTTSRERGRIFLEEVEACVDDTTDGDRLKFQVAALRRHFNLDEDVTGPIEDYEKFLDGVKALRYTERLAKRELGNRGRKARAQEAGGDGADSDETTLVVDKKSRDAM